LADGVCPMCGIGVYGQSLGLVTYYANEMEAFGRLMAPMRGCYSVCPYCFHAAFIAMDALKKALADRKSFS
jgi:hypothetical protein